jgi:hypothetical protein
MTWIYIVRCSNRTHGSSLWSSLWHTTWYIVAERLWYLKVYVHKAIAGAPSRFDQSFIAMSEHTMCF